MDIEAALGKGKSAGLERWFVDPAAAMALHKGNPAKAQLSVLGELFGGGRLQLASVEKLECKSAVGLPGYNCSFKWRADVLDKTGSKTGEDSDIGEGRFVKTGEGWRLMMDQLGR
jgi:hypothetical protein